MNSVRLRYYLLNLRMHRYFKKGDSGKALRGYIETCSRGDWFVLYQLSKNLNRPFFMDFLLMIARLHEEDKRNPHRALHDDGDEGDGIMDIMLKPRLTPMDSGGDKARDNASRKSEAGGGDDD